MFKNMDIETKKIFAGVVFITLVVAFFAFALNIQKFKSEKDEAKYCIYANFKRISSLGVGANVFVAGINSGKVVDLKLKDDYTVDAKIELNVDFKLPEDSTVAIHTDGLMGEKYIEITVGGDDENLIENGKYASYTQDSIDLDELIEQILAMARRKSEKSKVE